MAEKTGKDAPATDPQAPKTGPVRPPVLEGSARPTASGKSGDASAPADLSGKPAGDKSTSTTTPSFDAKSSSKSSSRPEPKPAPAGESDHDAGAPWLAGLIGGIIGLGAAYGLAWFGLWPTPAPAVPQADPRLSQFATAIPELESAANTTNTNVSALGDRVEALEAAQAAGSGATTDADLASKVADLSQRVDALATDQGDAASADTLAAIQASLDRLTAEAASAKTDLAQTRQQLTTLTQAAQDTAGTEAATLRLPLIFSGLDSAFSAGRSFETELAALREALPDTFVPEAIAGRAQSGLPRPDDVQRQLVAALPDILAGRPADADATWQESTADWFRGLIAMRPADAVDGNGPDAIVARLEAAVARRNFTAAQAELDSLPAPMRAAAGSVAADIESLAAAEAFMANVRDQALTGESGA